MSTKALKRELMAAVVMVLVAAIALSGSTYAWFVNNNKVTVEGLDLSVNTDNAFLLISKTKTTASQIQSEGKTTVDFNISGAASCLYPAATKLSANATTTGALNDYDNWYTAYAQASNSYVMDASSKTTLSAFTDYVIHETVYVTTDTTSNPVEKLTPTVTFVNKSGSNSIAASRVIISSATKSAIFSPAALDAPVSSSVDMLAGGQLTSSTAIKLDIYVYVDGNDSSIFTGGFANLAAAGIKIEFYGVPITTK